MKGEAVNRTARGEKMKNRKIKLACGIMIAALAMTSLAACSSSSSDTAVEESTETEASTETEDETAGATFEYTDGSDTSDLAGTTIKASVTAVDGSAITLSVMGGNGEMPEGEAPSGEAPEGEAPEGTEAAEGETPSGEAPEGEAPEGTEAAEGEAPSGDAPEGEAPSGEAPEGTEMGEAPEMESKEATLTISDESILNGVTLSDIAEGTNLEITFDADGNVESVSVAE